MTRSAPKSDQAPLTEMLEIMPQDITCADDLAVTSTPHPPLSQAVRRQTESDALDNAQRAIWPAVLAGDSDAIKLFLQIHDRRVKLWGLTDDQTPRDWVVRVERG
ncbi:MAG: hypothetical protein L0154_10850 [Chloroflexi bacterium]|nr:hypothetical protein [Chloroflexota bacterium]